MSKPSKSGEPAEPGNKSDLGIFVSRLSTKDMPVFSATVKHITEMSANHDSSMSELTLEVLRDPSLTSKLLTVANSAEYTRGIPVGTVSRAVMQLGFDAVKTVTISSCLLESVLKGQKKDKVVAEILKCLHAATQSRKMSKVLKNPASEEIFVATLLHRIGHIAFWSSNGELVTKLDRAIQERPNVPQEQLEREILGFSLNEVTASLAKEWSLGDIIIDSLNANIKNETTTCIRLGHAIAGRMADHGLDSEEYKTVISAVGKFLKMDGETALSFIKENTTETVDEASNFGIRDISKFIPLHSDQQPAQDSGTPPAYNSPDQILQIEVLAELNTMYREKKLIFNNFLATLLEGLSRGIGTDRVLLAVIDKERQAVVGRYGIGTVPADIEKFDFEIEPLSPTPVSEVLQTKKPEWVSPARRLNKFMSKEVLWRVKSEEFFLGVIQIRGKVLGVIYADRYTSGRRMTDDDFVSFRYFMNSANAILTSSM
jgi:HD-like signal output (HDOD) protein